MLLAIAQSAQQASAATWIAPLATIVVAVVAAFVTWYVPAWKLKREARLDTARALRHTRDPLLRAAFEAQSRCHNIASQNLLVRYLKNGEPDERDYVVMSTLWIIGQYLGWVEILRREVQYLDLGSRTVNRRLQLRLSDISHALATDASPEETAFMLFRADQRAIGEFMVTSREVEGAVKRPDCLGYSEFLDRFAALRSQARQRNAEPRPPILVWAERFEQGLERAADVPEHARRLVKVQHRLVDLVDLLDPERVRYPDVNMRGKLPLVPPEPADDETAVARFRWRGEAWPTVDEWAMRSVRPMARTDTRREYVGSRGPTGKRLRVVIEHDGSWVRITAGLERGATTRPIGGALRTSRARRVVNRLVTAFGRPTVADGSTLPGRAWRTAAGLARRARGIGER